MPLCVDFILGNIKMYLYFVSFLSVEMAQVIRILPLETQGCGNPASSIPWLLWPLLLTWFNCNHSMDK